MIQTPTITPSATGSAIATASRNPQVGIVPETVSSSTASAGRISLLACVASPLMVSPSAARSMLMPQPRNSRNPNAILIGPGTVEPTAAIERNVTVPRMMPSSGSTALRAMPSVNQAAMPTRKTRTSHSGGAARNASSTAP